MDEDIDVTKCEHYINSAHLDYNCNETPKSYYCKNKPNCYFKQLWRVNREVVKYQEEIMSLRKGYDEEDCTTTCPNIQAYEKTMKELGWLVDSLRITHYDIIADKLAKIIGK